MTKRYLQIECIIVLKIFYPKAWYLTVGLVFAVAEKLSQTRKVIDLKRANKNTKSGWENYTLVSEKPLKQGPLESVRIASKRLSTTFVKLLRTELIVFLGHFFHEFKCIKCIDSPLLYVIQMLKDLFLFWFIRMSYVLQEEKTLSSMKK